MAELPVGSTFAGCLIEGLAGAGGMGVVYRARQIALDRTVALKLISPRLAGDATFRERFQRESKIAASIDHPNVIPIYEAGEQAGELFLVMKYVEGTDLGGLIAREGRLAPDRTARIVREVGDALDAAHAAGLVHRDIKPGNVLISGAAGAERVYLTDFGLSKRAASGGASLTGTDHWVGTLHYVSPEQIRGTRVDARADIYSLTCLLYEALTGKAPFEREDEVATLFAHMEDDPPAVSATIGDTAFDAVVRRGMAKDPADRYQSAGDLGRAAVAAAADRPISQPERSVAVGPASPGSVPGGTAPTPPPAESSVGGFPHAAFQRSPFETWRPDHPPSGQSAAPPSPPVQPPSPPYQPPSQPAPPAWATYKPPSPPAQPPPSAPALPAWATSQSSSPPYQPPSPPSEPARPAWATYESPSTPVAAPESPPVAWTPGASSGSGGSSWSPSMGTLVKAVLAVTVVAVLVIVAVGLSGDPSPTDPPNTSPGGGSPPAPPDAPEADGPVTDAEIEALLDRFAEGYANEDPGPIEGVVAPDVEIYDKRPQMSDPRGEEAVLAWFSQQFDTTEVTGFELDDFQDGGSRPELRRDSASYIVSYANDQPLVGRIRFDVRRDDGEPQIVKFVIEP